MWLQFASSGQSVKQGPEFFIASHSTSIEEYGMIYYSPKWKGIQQLRLKRIRDVQKLCKEITDFVGANGKNKRTGMDPQCKKTRAKPTHSAEEKCLNKAEV